MSKRRVTISTALRRHIPESSGILVAVSGGRDSSVLLHALLAVRRMLRVRIEVCHVDHGLRQSSSEDAQFVIQWCAGLGVVCHVQSLGARPPQDNVEAWARRERYAALARVRESRQLDWIVTAHNANDVAETLLMRLMAKKELTSIDESDTRRNVLRPFLDIDRGQIDDYVSSHQVPYVDDPTNVDTSFVRNRVRHEVLPLLRGRFDPSIVWILAEQARSLAQDSDALRCIARGVVDDLGGVHEGDLEWLHRLRTALQGVPPAIQWRVVQALCTGRLGFVVGEAKARAMLRVIDGEELAIDLGSGLSFECSHEGLRFVSR